MRTGWGVATRHGERRASACCLLTIHALEIGTAEPAHSTLRSDKMVERLVLGAVRPLTALFHAPEVPGWLDRNGHLVAVVDPNQSSVHGSDDIRVACRHRE